MTEKTMKYKQHEYFINGDGLCYWRMTGKKPNLAQIKLCEAWLIMFGDKQKTPTKMCESYGFKHIVERYFHIYISNGAFIQACVNMGIEIIPESINARICINLKKWKKHCKQRGKSKKWN